MIQWLPDRFVIGGHSGNGWLTGWWMGPAGASDHLFATASDRETGSHLRLYARR